MRWLECRKARLLEDANIMTNETFDRMNDSQRMRALTFLKHGSGSMHFEEIIDLGFLGLLSGPVKNPVPSSRLIAMRVALEQHSCDTSETWAGLSPRERLERHRSAMSPSEREAYMEYMESNDIPTDNEPRHTVESLFETIRDSMFRDVVHASAVSAGVDIDKVIWYGPPPGWLEPRADDLPPEPQHTAESPAIHNALDAMRALMQMQLGWLPGVMR